MTAITFATITNVKITATTTKSPLKAGLSKYDRTASAEVFYKGGSIVLDGDHFLTTHELGQFACGIDELARHSSDREYGNLTLGYIEGKPIMKFRKGDMVIRFEIGFKSSNLRYLYHLSALGDWYQLGLNGLGDNYHFGDSYKYVDITAFNDFKLRTVLGKHKLRITIENVSVDEEKIRADLIKTAETALVAKLMAANAEFCTISGGSVSDILTAQSILMTKVTTANAEFYTITGDSVPNLVALCQIADQAARE